MIECRVLSMWCVDIARNKEKILYNSNKTQLRISLTCNVFEYINVRQSVPFMERTIAPLLHDSLFFTLVIDLEVP